MRLREFADIINKDLVITFLNNQKGRITCQFDNSETKQSLSSNVLEGTYGESDSVEGAIFNYTSQIRGKYLIFNAMDEHERETYHVPDNLDAD